MVVSMGDRVRRSIPKRKTALVNTIMRGVKIVAESRHTLDVRPSEFVEWVFADQLRMENSQRANFLGFYE